MTIHHAWRLTFVGLMLALPLAVSGCYVGPAPRRYAAPEWSYPRYAYRPAPYYGGGYGYGGAYGGGYRGGYRHSYWR